MGNITTEQLAQACRIFFNLAYPNGNGSIPAKLHRYLELEVDQPVSQYLPPGEFAKCVGQVGLHASGIPYKYSLRLGSVHFPQLKLQMELVSQPDGGTWVFSVDMHDAFSTKERQPPPDHPDAKHWIALQRTNRE